MSISIQHIRHATFVLTMNGKKIVVDPMLSDAGELPPVPFTRSLRRNPLTPMPVPDSFFDDMDAIIVTHRHFDHIDKKAISILNKTIPLFCPPEDEAYLQHNGFGNVQAIQESLEWSGIQFNRIKGQHAQGKFAKWLGPVSGFLVSSISDGSVYIVSDCIFTPAIEEAFLRHQPDIAILNTGRAQMLSGKIITMTADDIVSLARLSPSTKIIAVHMDAISHCTTKRHQLRAFLSDQNLQHSVAVPDDGEIITL